MPRSFVALALLLATTSGCAGVSKPIVRYLQPTQIAPHGSAGHAQHRLLAAHGDGSKDFVLVLRLGDDVPTALLDFALAEHVQSARFFALGAVRDAEVGWYEMSQQRYRAMRLTEPMEVLTLTGDIGLRATDGSPVVHPHVVLGRQDGSTFGGHLLSAKTYPTLEVFITTFPEPLRKTLDHESGLTLFDLEPG